MSLVSAALLEAQHQLTYQNKTLGVDPSIYFTEFPSSLQRFVLASYQQAQRENVCCQWQLYWVVPRTRE